VTLEGNNMVAVLIIFLQEIAFKLTFVCSDVSTALAVTVVAYTRQNIKKKQQANLNEISTL
jgi:hypothetical protein